jgi:hypothetical protein
MFGAIVGIETKFISDIFVGLAAAVSEKSCFCCDQEIWYSLLVSSKGMIAYIYSVQSRADQ